MPAEPDTHRQERPHRHRRSAFHRGVVFAGCFVAIYLLLAYGAVPYGWLRFEQQHPALDDLPGITQTANRIPGDPLNVALIGSEDDLKRAMLAAGWSPADPLTLKSCLEIAEATVLSRPYQDAPVSNLYLWGRKQDLAFEQPVGNNPRQRHHVRFWKAPDVDDANQSLWAGSVTFDARVGLSTTTGQVTHHIAADVDAERNRLFNELIAAGCIADVQAVAGLHKVRSGRNGGGDPWHTDGALYVADITLAERDAPRP